MAVTFMKDKLNAAGEKGMSFPDLLKIGKAIGLENEIETKQVLLMAGAEPFGSDFSHWRLAT
jgi:hypothetical protein